MFWMKRASRLKIVTIGFLEFGLLMHIASNVMYFKFSCNKELLCKVFFYFQYSSPEQPAFQYYLCKVELQYI